MPRNFTKCNLVVEKTLVLWIIKKGPQFSCQVFLSEGRPEAIHSNQTEPRGHLRSCTGVIMQANTFTYFEQHNIELVIVIKLLAKKILKRKCEENVGY